MVDLADYLKTYLDALPLILIVVWIYWTHIVGGPWVPTSMQIVRRMMELAAVNPDDVVYDLGCGDGRILLTAALRYHARAVGIEIDPLRYIWCQLLITILFQRKRIRIIFGNFYKMNLNEADVIMCYLMPDALVKLEEKLRQELQSETRVVTNKYVFPTLDMVREDGNARLYMVNPIRDK